MEPSPTNPPTDFYRLQHRPTTREGNLRSADMRILLSFSGNPPRIVCELAHTRTIACADLSALGGPRTSSACDSQDRWHPRPAATAIIFAWSRSTAENPCDRIAPAGFVTTDYDPVVALRADRMAVFSSRAVPHDTLTARTAVLAGRPDREGRTFGCGSPRAMRPAPQRLLRGGVLANCVEG